MSYLPDGASFEERVQDYFLAVRGSGLMLAALDVELLSGWARAGAPFEVVARGIRKAAEKALFDARPGEPVLKSLRACRRQVEAEIQRHQTRATGAASGAHAPRAKSWEESRKKALEKTLSQALEARPALSGIVASLSRAVAETPATPDALARLEDVVHVALCRALPFAERRRVWRQARESTDGWSASRTARVLGRRIRIAAALKRLLELG